MDGLSPVERPVIRWFGGKWVLAPWIVRYFPDHRTYNEPYGGGGSVLLRKPRSYAEVYNDLDGEVVNLFRVLRNRDQAARLIELLRLTPFARAELAAAYELCEEPVERARRLIALAFMGFGSNAHARVPTGFRANSNKSGTTPARDWVTYADALPLAIERLQGVTIECRDACEVMAQQDSARTLHYVDPPYIHSTRGRGNLYDVAYRGYSHELTDQEHAGLLAFLLTLKGMVVLSGYPHPMYDAALPGWRRVQRAALADGARARVEVLWINPAAVEAIAGGPLLARAHA